MLDPLPGAKGGGEQGALPSRLEPCALDIGLCRLDRVFRFSDLRVLRRLSRFEVVDGGLSAEKISFGLRHSGAVIIILDSISSVTLFDALKIIHRDATHIALDMRAQRRDVAAHIGVIRDLPNRQANPPVPLVANRTTITPAAIRMASRTSVIPDHGRRRALGMSGGARCAGAEDAKAVSRSEDNGCSAIRANSSVRRQYSLMIHKKLTVWLRSILDNKFDRQTAQRPPANGVPILHPNIRGPRYYH